MSSTYNKNKKELAGVKVLGSTKVWSKDKNNKYKLNSELDFVGKVDLTLSSMVLKANQKDKQTAFVDDISALPKRTKDEIVKHFFDKNGNRNNKTVAYLVRTDNKSKTNLKKKEVRDTLNKEPKKRD